MDTAAGNLSGQIGAILARIPEVRFAYLFGSHAHAAAGPLSDVDVAVFLADGVAPFDFRLRLMEILAHNLKTESFDLITLNDATPLLRYEVIRGGRVIKEERAARVGFEARTLGEYLDMAYLRRTQAQYLKEQLARGGLVGE